jgi:putative membrane protein
MRTTVLMLTASLWVGVGGCGDRDDAIGDTSVLTADTTAGNYVNARGDTSLGRPGSGSVGADTAAADPSATGDARALAAFIAVSQHEVQHGQLAASRGTAKAVRDLGTTIARDHDDLAQRGRELVTKHGLKGSGTAGDTLLALHGSRMGELRSKSGDAFDRAFLQHENEYNRWIIDRIRTTLLPMATNAEVRTFLEQALPILDAHAKAAQELAAKPAL